MPKPDANAAGGMAGTSGTGGEAGSAGHGGAGIPCADASQCPDPVKECLITSCDMGVCATMAVPFPTPTIDGQFDGDCKIRICDGSSNVIIVDDDNDFPNDDNVCTIDTCSGGQHVFTPKAGPCSQNGGTMCGDPAGPKAGQCVECNVDADCSTPGYVCDPAGGTNTCVPATCSDGAQNGLETGIDCGGDPCSDCPCQTGGDCQSGFCQANICAPCSTHFDCMVTEYCNPTMYGGTCVADEISGSSCNAVEECQSSHCVDGVCCDSACSGACEACSLPGNIGTCTNPVGYVSSNDCPGNQACAVGSCSCALGFPNPPKLPVFWTTEWVDINNDGKIDNISLRPDNKVRVLLGHGNGTFGAPADYPTAVNPSFFKVHDVNGDSHRDIVAVTAGDTLSVLINQGNGTFATNIDYAIGTKPTSLVIADLSGDGKPEIALTNGANANWFVSVFVNDGNGGFASKIDYPTSDPVDKIVAADFNGDGLSDLATTKDSGSAGDVGVLINNGNGTFAPRIDYDGIFEELISLAAVDLNGDGKPDLVGQSDHDTLVYMNTGNGAFLPFVKYVPGYSRGFLRFADINGDTHPDLYFNLLNIDNFANEALILWNDGNGVFSDSVHFPSNNDTAAIIDVADVDADGKLDIVIASWDGYHRRSTKVFRNNGNQTFSVMGTYPVAAFEAVDVTADGKPDLVTYDEIFLNVGDGTFITRKVSPIDQGLSPNSVRAMASLDVNGDGTLDLAVARNIDSPVGYMGLVDLLVNDGSGSFALSSYYYAGDTVSSMATADFDGNGSVDLAIAEGWAQPHHVAVLFFRANGTFIRAEIPINSNSTAVAAGDFNADGLPDLAVAKGSLGAVSVLTYDGNGGFNPAGGYVTNTQDDFLAASDLNGDGLSDLVVANANNVGVLLNNGGAFSPQIDYPVSANPRDIVVTDLNGDGKADLAVLTTSLHIFINSGDGTLTPKVDYPWSGDVLTAADFNGDNSTDLALGKGALLLNDGTGRFVARGGFGGDYGAAVAADLNGDGKPDLAFAETYVSNMFAATYSEVTVHLNTCLP